jgi:hypothetical protein
MSRLGHVRGRLYRGERRLRNTAMSSKNARNTTTAKKRGNLDVTGLGHPVLADSRDEGRRSPPVVTDSDL